MERHRAAVPCPPLGKGAFLRFRNDALDAVEREYGPEWFSLCLIRLEPALDDPRVLPAAMIVFLLKQGAWSKQDARLPEDFINDDVPLRECVRPLIEALSLATTGLAYDDLVADMQRRAGEFEAKIRTAEEEAKAKADGNPPSAQV